MAHLILYDGSCGLCHRVVEFVLRRDKKNLFVFASLQSEIARPYLSNPPKEAPGFDTVVVIADYDGATPTILQKSDAAFFIGGELGGLWRLFGVLRLLPRCLRDMVYDFIAKNRFKWFGSADTCRPITPDHRSRFLDLSR